MEQNKNMNADSVEEQVTDALRSLFARYGYRRYEMSNFESYDMYVNHKSFLNNNKIITFTDVQGKLKALKPDVTMSIVKNTKETDTASKLFYIESVFRALNHADSIKEIKQMGIEFIGCDDVYSEAEVVELAKQSLAAISADYMLDLSHMGFVTGILNDINTTPENRNLMREAIRNKNAHELKMHAQNANCTQKQVENLTQLVQLSGEFKATLERAKKLVCNEEMELAVKSLSDIYEVLANECEQDKLRLDFSITSDVDYYNGIMLHGYVKDVPSAVLVGGRYDNLMKSFNKPQKALGFAVYLGALNRAFAKPAEFDVDTLVIYSENSSPKAVMQTVKELQKEGKSVFSISAAHKPLNLSAQSTIYINDKNEVTQ